jgi:hypothetical protein
VLAFEIEVDGERQFVAGTQDWSLLALHIDALRHGDDPSGEEIRISMGGLSEPDANGVPHHVRWGNRTLQIGSKVTVTIVETDEPSDPIRRYRSDHEVQENPFTDEEIAEFERADWLRLKAKFEPDA